MARGLIARPCRRLGVQFNSCRSLLGSRSDSGPLLPSLQHHLVFSPSSLHASWIYYFISVESKASKMDPLDRASIYPGTSFDERRSSIGKKWSRDPRPLSVFAPPDHSWASDRLAPGSFATMFRDLTCTVRSPTSSNLRAACGYISSLVSIALSSWAVSLLTGRRSPGYSNLSARPHRWRGYIGQNCKYRKYGSTKVIFRTPLLAFHQMTHAEIFVRSLRFLFDVHHLMQFWGYASSGCRDCPFTHDPFILREGSRLVLC
jgi:hypothetical protein